MTLFIVILWSSYNLFTQIKNCAIFIVDHFLIYQIPYYEIHSAFHYFFNIISFFIGAMGGPEGGSLRDIVTAGTVLVALGERVGLFLSTDSGANWKSLTGVTDLSSEYIRAVTANSNVIYASTGCYIFRSQDNGTTWTKLAGSASLSLTTKMILKGNTLFLTGNSSVHKSTDSGVTFIKINMACRQ